MPSLPADVAVRHGADSKWRLGGLIQMQTSIWVAESSSAETTDETREADTKSMRMLYGNSRFVNGRVGSGAWRGRREK